jgi:membrane protein
MGAALSYYALFSLFPIFLVILSVIGIVLAPDIERVNYLLGYVEQVLLPLLD